MSVQDRYSKIIESLVNGEGEVASDLLHEAFVDKAREIWSGLVEQDEIVEDDISEEEIEESYFDENEDEVESYKEEITAEEQYAMEDDDEETEFDAEGEAEFELAGDDEMDMDMEMDMGAEGDMESEAGIEDAMLSVEDALADLKAEFAQLMGDDLGDEEESGLSDELPADDFASDIEPDAEENEFEELEEAADLTKIGKDGMHPKDMPAGDDGKASPVASKNDMGGKVIPTGSKSAEGSKKGLSDVTAKDMGVTHPGDGASLKPETRGHGAEKRGMKQ
jgi:hypothetical protein